MALTLNHFLQCTTGKYQVELLTEGVNLDKFITWIYQMEDAENCIFIRGGELIISTALVIRDEEGLLNLCMECWESGACGIAFFIGQHLQQVPHKVLEWCDENQFPVFGIPWQIRLVDIMQFYCNEIITDKKTKEIRDNHLLYALLGKEKLAENSPLRNMEKSYLLASNVELTVTHFAKCFIDGINFYLCRRIPEINLPINVGISEVITNFDNFSKYKVQSVKALKVGILQGKIKTNYKDIGLYKVVLSLNDKELFLEAEELLKPLEDENTRRIFRTYLEKNRSVVKVAEELFLHRNTVNYHVQKAKEKLNYENNDRDIEYLLAFYMSECNKKV